MKLILKSGRNLLENTNKEAPQMTAVPLKNSYKILNIGNILKNLLFLFQVLLEVGEKIRNLLTVFCDEIKQPQTVTFFLANQKYFFHFQINFVLSSPFFLRELYETAFFMVQGRNSLVENYIINGETHLYFKHPRHSLTILQPFISFLSIFFKGYSSAVCD